MKKKLCLIIFVSVSSQHPHELIQEKKWRRSWQIVSSIGFIQKKIIIIIMIYSSVNHVIREKKLHFASFYYLYLRIGNQNAFSNLYFFPFECILFARKQNLEG